MADTVQERTLSHTGGEVGSDNVTLEQNQTNPQMETPIISWECPREFEWIHYNGQKHSTRFVPRRVQSVSGTTGDDTVVALDNDIQPIAGKRKIDEQPFPVAVAADNNGNRVSISDVDYAQNEVTLASDPASGSTWYVYPVITEGVINFRGVNQFGQVEGSLTDWGAPLYRFSDFPQLKQGTEINLDGEARWDRYEEVQVTIDSPWKVTWTHANYPLGEYVSSLEQTVEVKI